MNWKAAGAIGEIVGALGVIATLGYLAVQTRHNTKAIKASTFQANTQLWQEWFLALAGSDAPGAYAQGMLGNPNLDGSAFQKFWMACRALFLNFESQYYQYREGVLQGIRAVTARFDAPMARNPRLVAAESRRIRSRLRGLHRRNDGVDSRDRRRTGRQSGGDVERLEGSAGECNVERPDTSLTLWSVDFRYTIGFSILLPSAT